MIEIVFKDSKIETMISTNEEIKTKKAGKIWIVEEDKQLIAEFK